jgi:hypothetical protein
MSRLSGFIDPETRAYVEAVTAAVRPGRHLPDATLVETRVERSGAQRCHDGIKLGLKAGIAPGGMGSYRGHPVTVIVRTTLAELNQAAHAVSNPDSPMPVWLVAQSKSFVVMGSNTSAISDTSAFFSSDRTAIRATMRVSFGWPHQAAVVRIGTGGS